MEDGEATWIGLYEPVPGAFEPAIAGGDLYAGLPGITLFMAQLGRLRPDGPYSGFARSAARILASLDPRVGSSAEGCGAFAGLAGAVYALCQLAVVLGDPTLLTAASRHVATLDASLPDALHGDVVGGAAGCVLALLAADAAGMGDEALRVARTYGDWLARDAERVHDEAADHNLPAPDSGGAGFAHGPAGIAYALRRLSSRTQVQRFEDVANRLFGVSDQRTALASAAADASWCRGSGGLVGALVRTCPQPAPDWICSAVDDFVAGRLGADRSDCLCHGAAGTLDVLLAVERWEPGGRGDPTIGQVPT